MDKPRLSKMFSGSVHVSFILPEALRAMCSADVSYLSRFLSDQSPIISNLPVRRIRSL